MKSLKKASGTGDRYYARYLRPTYPKGWPFESCFVVISELRSACKISNADDYRIVSWLRRFDKAIRQREFTRICGTDCETRDFIQFEEMPDGKAACDCFEKLEKMTDSERASICLRTRHITPQDTLNYFSNVHAPQFPIPEFHALTESLSRLKRIEKLWDIPFEDWTNVGTYFELCHFLAFDKSHLENSFGSSFLGCDKSHLENSFDSGFIFIAPMLFIHETPSTLEASRHVYSAINDRELFGYAYAKLSTWINNVWRLRHPYTTEPDPVEKFVQNPSQVSAEQAYRFVQFIAWPELEAVCGEALLDVLPNAAERTKEQILEIAKANPLFSDDMFKRFAFEFAFVVTRDDYQHKRDSKEMREQCGKEFFGSDQTSDRKQFNDARAKAKRENWASEHLNASQVEIAKHAKNVNPLTYD